MKPKQKIYLDYNATTPVDPRVLEEMIPYFTEKFGNFSSHSHAFGWEAEEAVDIAREQVASLIGARPSEIIFTSGATEALNLALMGTCRANQPRGNHLITCATEHRAVLDTCHHLEDQGFRVTFLPVDAQGRIDLTELQTAITDQTILIGLMAANNETGVLHPLEKIAQIAQERDILFLCDATQAVGKIPFDMGKLGIDMAALSAHKIYGPKGIGALCIRKRPGWYLTPQLFGGGQEKGLRPGTLNVPGIVGLGKACEIAAAEMEAEGIRLQKLRDQLEGELTQIKGVQVNGGEADRLPHMTNLSFAHLDGNRLIRSLKHLALSRGSACSSATEKPSHVLTAMGLSEELALASLRIGLGRFTTQEEVEIAIRSIMAAVEKLLLLGAGK